jgi:hypothetical protein
MKKIGVILLGCCLGVILSASVATAGPKGECNRILAKNLGEIEKINHGTNAAASCIDLLEGLIQFIFDPNCSALLENGDLFVNPDSGVVQDACNVLSGCGVGGALPPSLCPN